MGVEPANEAGFDLAAYLERLGCAAPLPPTLATLATLLEAHLGAIPFENLDVRLGRPPRLDLGTLQAKLVRAGRGGYCFEQNTLFAAALRALGFEVSTLEARVRPADADLPLPRTHMLLSITVEGRAYLADVGFGADGPLVPVALDGVIAREAHASFRVESEPGAVLVLRHARDNGAYQDLYAFTRTPALPVDFEVANHYTATYPSSVFLKTLTIQRSTPQARFVLRGRTLTLRKDSVETRRPITEAELPELLRDAFRLNAPVEDVIRALPAAAEG